MMISSVISRLAHVGRRLRHDVELPGPRRLRLANRLSQARLAGGDGPVVSMTSYGERISLCHLALESIARGTLRPRRTILWLDDEEAFARPPRSLQRLKRRGLEIRRADNFGPHTKYFPYIEGTPDFIVPLVTADDDTIYPRHWLKTLHDEHMATPDMIVCYRARLISRDAHGFAPYATWPLSNESGPTTANLVTGVSGALHPPQLLRALKTRGRAFLDTSPRNDDIWLHHTALRLGMPTRVIGGESITFPLIDGSQEQALWYVNLSQGENDRQLRATYSSEDIEQISAPGDGGERLVAPSPPSPR